MAKTEIYTGPVVFSDGWHHTVTLDENGQDAPGERLVTDGDGVYRVATDADTESHNDRHGVAMASIVMEDGSDGVRVSADELEEINNLLRERRGGQ